MSANRPAAVVVLAAGEGTRMKSATPKVLHEICGRPMVLHVIYALEPDAHRREVANHRELAAVSRNGNQTPI